MIRFDPPAHHKIPEDRYEPVTVGECRFVDRCMVCWGNILAETAFNFHRGYDTDAIYRAMRNVRKA